MVVLQTKHKKRPRSHRTVATVGLVVITALVMGGLYIGSGSDFLGAPRVTSAVTCVGTTDPDPLENPAYGPYNTSAPRIEPSSGTYSFADPDGIDLTYIMYLPYDTGANQAPGPYPLIIWVNGGFFESTDPTVSPELYYRTFTTEGYAIASARQRTKGEAIWPAQLEDIRTFIHYMRVNADRFNIDPDNIFLFGTSSGGLAVSTVGVTDDAEYPSQYGCYPDVYDSSVNGVITMNGIIDTSTLDCVSVGGGVWCNDDMVTGGNVMSALMTYVGCDYNTPGFSIGDDPLAYCPALANAAPGTHADVGDTTPYLLLHGAADGLVYPLSNTSAESSLAAAGVPVTRCQIDIQSNGGTVPDGNYNDTGHTTRGIFWEKDTIFNFIENYRV